MICSQRTLIPCCLRRSNGHWRQANLQLYLTNVREHILNDFFKAEKCGFYLQLLLVKPTCHHDQVWILSACMKSSLELFPPLRNGIMHYSVPNFRTYSFFQPPLISIVLESIHAYDRRCRSAEVITLAATGSKYAF